MKTYDNELTFQPADYPLHEIYDLGTVLFVDIETTGFSAKTSALYEIGCIYFENNQPRLVQYFAEHPNEEVQILTAFFTLCENHSILIHYNGNTFDLPFMKAKAAQYGLAHPFDRMEGIDIFQRVSPYKKILGLENCKQKTVEQFLGIDREDLYNGGQLIAVYQEYCKTPTKDAEDLLILHNRDDMKGMLKLLPILTYADIFLQPFRVVKVQSNHYADENGNGRDEVLMKIRFFAPFPKPIAMNKADCYFSASKTEGFLKVPLYHEEMKYFYSNYKDYYYLPVEDVALHKSVASFVDKEHRRQAKASNCYTRKESLYLPQWDILFTPIFKRSYEDKLCFFELTEEMKKQPEVFRQYALHILDMLAHS
jgi:uncharacterized protein YprB with RNaseH-like and TPR domain